MGRFLAFNSLHEPYSDPVPSFPECCAFFPKLVGYPGINWPCNLELGRECQDQMVQPSTVQMGSSGLEMENDLPRSCSSAKTGTRLLWVFMCNTKLWLIIKSQGPPKPLHPHCADFCNHCGQEKYLWNELSRGLLRQPATPPKKQLRAWALGYP